MTTKPVNRLLNLLSIVVLSLSGLPFIPSSAASLSGAHSAQMLPVESLLNPDGTLNTSTGATGALDLRGWNVTLDSARGPILTREAPAPAASNANIWSALAHNGLDNIVRVLAVSGSDLYVGGYFTATSDGTVTNLNHIARYSGGAWSALAHNGLDGDVLALAVMGGDLYVGGVFTQTADGNVTNLNGIARYGGGTWSALANNGLANNGRTNEVGALAVSGSDLYVGGSFTQTADGTVKNLNNIARYSGGAWSALANNGLNDGVGPIAVIGSDLYVGGGFSQTADGTVTNLNFIARYSGGAWSPLANNGLDNLVDALAVSGSDLYVGGWFHSTADGTMTNLNSVARYSGDTWLALANDGLDNPVDALAVSGSDLYVGGIGFDHTWDGAVTNLNIIAKYSGGAWSPVANNGLQVGAVVYALAASGSDLYVSGDFHQTADGAVTNLNYIASLGISTAPGFNVYLPLVFK